MPQNGAALIAERVLESRAGAAVPRLSSFIGGRYDESDATGDDIDVLDPASGTLIARVAEAGPAGVDRAVAAGEAAFAAWRATPARDRGALVQRLAQRIQKNAEHLAHLDTLDTGNPLSAMQQDLTKGVRTMNDAAGLALQMTGLTFPLPGLHYTQGSPRGVVGRLITFNHPAMYACARLGSALVAGNCVVMKPSELAPIATLAIAELTAGLLPDGVVSSSSAARRPVTGDSDGNAFGYFGTAPSFIGCPVETWLYEDLTGPGDFFITGQPLTHPPAMPFPTRS